jgi:excisionase family DNA binding protein
MTTLAPPAPDTWSPPATLTRHEAARMLRVSLDTVDRLRRAGKIRSAKFNNTVRINRDDVVALVDTADSTGTDDGEVPR